VRPMTALPAELVSTFDGAVPASASGTALSLVTVDDDGWPREAHLSVGEVLARGDSSLRLCTWPRSRTTGNLRRDGRAMLVAVAGGSAKAGAPETQKQFLMRTALDAQVSSERIRTAVAKTPLVAYPGHGLANQLKMIGAMIRDGMPTRVYYASMGGFDTHGGQLGTHANLMRQLGESLEAFQRDLREQRNDARVTTMVFSEFGRRVKQNASGGTDHGTAAPMFLIGTNVKPGVVGRHPSLTDLDQGDLKHSIDFRSVYASVLEDWLKAPSEKVLRGRFMNAGLFKASV